MTAPVSPRVTFDCEQATAEIGNGVAAALRAVDCEASQVTGAAFGSLFAPGGVLGPVLTLVLVIFVALFGLALLLGRTNVSVRSLVPRMITLGLVLTFATSWAAYQGVVWNLWLAAPDWLAARLTGVDGSATGAFAGKLDVVFAAVEQATQTGVADNVPGGEQAAAAEVTAFTPKGTVWMGAMLLLLGTVGVLVTARIGLAVLIALGPLFVVMALFPATRGLFAGWLKGVTMLALVPLFAVLAGGIMLEMAIPILNSLSAVPGEVGMRPAVAFFLIGFVHAALMVLVLTVSGKIVGNWTVFGLAREDGDRRSGIVASATPGATTVVTAPAGAPMSTAQAAAGMSAAPRRTVVTGTVPAMAANDGASAAPDIGSRRETRVFATSSGSGPAAPATASPSRSQGIGNRFRPANAPTASFRSASGASAARKGTA